MNTLNAVRILMSPLLVSFLALPTLAQSPRDSQTKKFRELGCPIDTLVCNENSTTEKMEEQVAKVSRVGLPTVVCVLTNGRGGIH